MDLHAWLDLPENRGKAAWLAGQLGRSKAAVSLWRDDGVPMNLMCRISVLTDGQVQVQDMLSHALRCKTRAASAPQEARDAA
jgi:hypothetical protein